MEKIGWFDAFRERGGPTWYGDNRTRVVTDTGTLGIVLVFALFTVAFLLILPGLRKHKLSSFLSVTLNIFVGAILLITIHHPTWHVGQVAIYTPFRAHTEQKIDAIIGVRVGLSHVNITLTTSEIKHDAGAEMHLDFNERFFLNEVQSMAHELDEGLHGGLPYPILSVIEYLSVDRAGFMWGRQYRLAGYYTLCMLWACVGVWSICIAVLCLLPQYFSRAMIVQGACIWCADAIYVMCCPNNLTIRFPDVDAQTPRLEFSLSWCFWLTVTAGGLCLLYGTLIRVCELRCVDFQFVTFLQSDYNVGRRKCSSSATSEHSLVSTSRYSSSLDHTPPLDRYIRQRPPLVVSIEHDTDSTALRYNKSLMIQNTDSAAVAHRST